ncbi:hypothetical protein PR048_005781 [Dryococelus australis]|uniref:Uncharacterized protein n=1 Tax=Dryococelus australis TaxID=614101 RepID=A0ABQ9IA39_9NEOP|nr:hypothetical protein PR048_005781 [Dryococelus australis]
MMQCRNERVEETRKTCRPVTSSGTIPICKNPRSDCVGNRTWFAQMEGEAETVSSTLIKGPPSEKFPVWLGLGSSCGVTDNSEFVQNEPTRVIEVNMDRRRNEGMGETGDPRENPPNNGTIRHDSHLRKSGTLQSRAKPEPCPINPTLIGSPPGRVCRPFCATVSTDVSISPSTDEWGGGGERESKKRSSLELCSVFRAQDSSDKECVRVPQGLKSCGGERAPFRQRLVTSPAVVEDALYFFPRPSVRRSVANLYTSKTRNQTMMEQLRNAMTGGGGEGVKIPEKTRRPAASSDTIPACENPELTRPKHPTSIPGRVTGFSQVGIVPDDAIGQWVFSGISRYPRPSSPAPLHIHFNHPHRLSKPR